MLRPMFTHLPFVLLALSFSQLVAAQVEPGARIHPDSIGEPPVDEPIIIPVEQAPNTPVTFADERPVYPGGDAALAKELAKRLKYPKDALEAGIQGKVYLQYVVGVDGTIGDIKVIRGVFPPMDKAAVDALKSMPPYERPAMIGGKPVPFQMTLPVMFRSDL